MPQYETKICHKEETGVTLADLEAFLNKMGKDEWKLVTINLKSELIFQREIAINPKIRAKQLKEVQNAETGSSEAVRGIPEEGV